MAARKLQQEVDKCFKKVSEGVAEFESIYEKIETSQNAAQKEKLEDNLKREIKKLQRLRDQIKTWAANNDIKDKSPLLEHRKLIETQMEKFKAVEKAMKTKAYSKEGLSAAAKLDPKERAKMEACEFLGNMVDELERQIETLEAEGESLQAGVKRGKNKSSNADRLAEIDKFTERHKWHQGKLELIKRSLENGGVETEQVTDLEETIRYYVSDGMEINYMEDETMYDDLNLDEEEDAYGMNIDNDRVSSQDTQSILEDGPDTDSRSNSIPGGKSKTASAPEVNITRRPSAQMKSPLPALATLNAPLSSMANGSGSHMKPAAVPTRAPGEILKYASAAAAAAASDKIGLAPLPPPPDSIPGPSTSSNHPPLASHGGRRLSITASPTAVHSQPANQTPVTKSGVPNTISDAPSTAQTRSPALSQSSAVPSVSSVSNHPASELQRDIARSGPSRSVSGKAPALSEPPDNSKAHSNVASNGIKNVLTEEDESIFHLPSGLQDLLHSFEATQRRVDNATSQVVSPSTQRMLAASQAGSPKMVDTCSRRNYRPDNRINTPSYYPQEVDPVFDDPQLYNRIDPDTLFYVFYYKQGSYQQYLAARALKDQSWRFHTQYQTWFQRHEEPKNITEEFEQGTYRFFDYESTCGWVQPYPPALNASNTQFIMENIP